jgi:hypothetical protein
MGLHEPEAEPEPSFHPRKVETVQFRDHSSLPGPSSTIRFRSKAVTSHVYPDSHGQFIIDDEYDDEGNRTFTTRRMETETIGLLALRFVYTLVAVFFVSILVQQHIDIEQVGECRVTHPCMSLDIDIDWLPCCLQPSAPVVPGP